jgi:hypothetical protein
MIAALPLAERETIVTATIAKIVPVIAARIRSLAMAGIVVPRGADRPL